jgi:hypothetical protein
MSAMEFTYDVFLSHSAKDKAVARPLAGRLREAGLRVWYDEWEIKPGDSIPAKIDPPSLQSYGGTREGLKHSRVLACHGVVASGRRRMLCRSANAFGSDWVQLACPALASGRRRKTGTCGRCNLPFRDPLNRKHRFIPARLDQGSARGYPAQFLYLDWLKRYCKQEPSGVGCCFVQRAQRGGHRRD